MSKTLTLNTCKLLKEAGIEVETEKYYCIYWILNNWAITDWPWWYPAPNLEESIELLPFDINWYSLQLYKCNNWSWNIAYVKNSLLADIIIDRLTMWNKKTLLEAVEAMINYLLDNQLLSNDR